MELDEIKVGQKYHWNRREGFAIPGFPDRELRFERELPTDIVTAVGINVECVAILDALYRPSGRPWHVAPSTLSPLTEGESI